MRHSGVRGPLADNLTRYREVARLLKRQGIGSLAGRLMDIPPGAAGRRVVGGKTLREWSDKLDPVLSGKAAIVPVSKVKDAKYRKTYERFKGGKSEYLLVPHSADEAVRVKRGKIEIDHPSGFTRVQIPVEYRNLEQYLEDAKKLKYDRTGYKAYGFRFYGGSSGTFSRLEDLFELLQHYGLVEESIDEDDRKTQKDIYRNLEIVKIKSTAEWRKSSQRNLFAKREKAKRKRRRKKK